MYLISRLLAMGRLILDLTDTSRNTIVKLSDHMNIRNDKGDQSCLVSRPHRSVICLAARTVFQEVLWSPWGDVHKQELMRGRPHMDPILMAFRGEVALQTSTVLRTYRIGESDRIRFSHSMFHIRKKCAKCCLDIALPETQFWINEM